MLPGTGNQSEEAAGICLISRSDRVRCCKSVSAARPAGKQQQQQQQQQGSLGNISFKGVKTAQTATHFAEHSCIKG
jgi:hypothetical protein